MTELFTLGIPFFFVLAIVYGAIEVSSVFANKKVKMLIALAIAAITVANQQAVDLINQFLPFTAIFFIIIFFVGTMKKVSDKNKDWELILIIIGLILILLVRQGEGLRDYFDKGPLNYENFIILIASVVMLLMFYTAYKKGKA